MHIITCVGYYSQTTYSDYVLQKNAKDLAAHMMSEVTHGIGDTGVKPGIIGELAAKDHIPTAEEEKVLRACAWVHNDTGLPISLHSAIGRPALNQIAVLEDEGALLERVIVSHADYGWCEDIQEDIDFYQRILDKGSYLEFDQIGWNDVIPELEDIRRVMALLDKGYAGRLLLSSDLCRRSQYHKYGGRGYDYVLRSFVETLKKHGASDLQVKQMLVDNPRELLCV